jgi:hypothetical protein
MLSSGLFPLTLYGPRMPCFAVKLEMYVRVRGIPCTLQPLRTACKRGFVQ